MHGFNALKYDLLGYNDKIYKRWSLIILFCGSVENDTFFFYWQISKVLGKQLCKKMIFFMKRIGYLVIYKQYMLYFLSKCFWQPNFIKKRSLIRWSKNFRDIQSPSFVGWNFSNINPYKWHVIIVGDVH